LKKVLAIINPKAGVNNNTSFKDLLWQYLDHNKFKLTTCLTEYAGHGKILAAEAVKDKIDIVIAVGGDGTINEIASSLLFSPVHLGIIACGSGNGLARHLKLPLSPKEAIEVINKFHSKTIDTGIFNDQFFLCTAGVGFEGEVSKKFDEAKGRGIVTYGRSILQSFGKFEGFTASTHKDIPLITYCIANASQYGNNVFIAPKASLQDGFLDVCLLKKFNPWQFPSVAKNLFTGTIANSNIHSVEKKEKISVKFSRELPAHVDGEYIGFTDHINAEIRKSSLNVLF